MNEEQANSYMADFYAKSVDTHNRILQLLKHLPPAVSDELRRAIADDMTASNLYLIASVHRDLIVHPNPLEEVADLAKWLREETPPLPPIGPQE